MQIFHFKLAELPEKTRLHAWLYVRECEQLHIILNERPLEQRITSRINIDVKLRMLNWDFTGDFSWISFTVMGERKKDMDLEGNPVPGACLVSLLQACVPSNFTFRKILVT